MQDQFSEYYQDYLSGTYDCVDRIVINAYHPLLHGGGFRTWWRTLYGDDSLLDNTHLMRFAGHFSRRLRAFAEKRKIPLRYCEAGTRKHEIAEKYLPQDPSYRGLFCILASKAPAAVLDVQRYGQGGINIRKKTPLPYVQHYFFHIIDQQWGHVTIKFCPHPPFHAMIILNGHEYVERAAQRRGIAFAKEGNCFTDVPNAAAVAGIADTMRASCSVGRLAAVCERWLYTCCLCFALSRDEQERSGFRYRFSVYQVEYSRNLLFAHGSKLDKVFNGVIDRTRSQLDVRSLKTIFGYQHRPYHRDRNGKLPRVECVVEKPVYDLTVFKLHFSRLTVKMYSKGERVLRIEALAHNTADLRCGKSIEKFPLMVSRLALIVQNFMDRLHGVDISFVDTETLERWPCPGKVGQYRTAGIDINKPRLRAVMNALIALSIDPHEITAVSVAQKVQEKLPAGPDAYTVRQAAYDLRKFRGKKLVVKCAGRKKYAVTDEGLRAMTAYIILRDKVMIPALSSCLKKARGVNLKNRSQVEIHIAAMKAEMQKIFNEYHIAA